jgi:hypothetical protein
MTWRALCSIPYHLDVVDGRAAGAVVTRLAAAAALARRALLLLALPLLLLPAAAPRAAGVPLLRLPGPGAYTRPLLGST